MGKRILMVTTISRTIKAFLVPHIRMLLEMGHQVDVATKVEEEMGLPEEVKVFNVPFSRSPLSPSNLLALLKLRELLKKGGYHLLHVHTPIASFVGRISALGLTGLKVLYTAHGFHFYDGAPRLFWLLYYPLERMASRLTDAIVTINKEDYKRALNFKLKHDGQVFLVDGVGVDLSRFRPPEEEERKRSRRSFGLKEEFAMACVGELNKNKNQAFLIRSMSRLKERLPSARLLIAGDGPEREGLALLAERLGLREEVRLLGHIGRVEELLWACDLALSSSLREGLPVNLIEAMACGLPIVASDCRGNRDLVIDGENGFLYRVGDEEGLLLAILRLHDDDELRGSMGRTGANLAKRFSLPFILDKMKEIYEGFLS